jgi:hypothetical protein
MVVLIEITKIATAANIPKIDINIARGSFKASLKVKT